MTGAGTRSRRLRDPRRGRGADRGPGQLSAAPIHAILVLDLSYSVSGERLRDLRGASHALLDALGRDDRASLLTFTMRCRDGACQPRMSARSARCSTRWNPRGSTVRGYTAPDPRRGRGAGFRRRKRRSFSARTGVQRRRRHGKLAVVEPGARCGSGDWRPGLWRVRAGIPAARCSAISTELTGRSAVEAESTRNLRAVFIRGAQRFPAGTW